jgi:hypothetical protein
MNKYIILFVFLLFIVVSCTHSPEKALNSVITKSSAEEDISLIENNYKQIDSTKIRTLNNLLNISKGYEAYTNDLKSKKSILSKFVVDKKTFDLVSDSVFNYFKTNKITYKKLLGELDAMNRINNKYSKLTSISSEKRKSLEVKFACRNWFSFNQFTLELFNIPKI